MGTKTNSGITFSQWINTKKNIALNATMRSFVKWAISLIANAILSKLAKQQITFYFTLISIAYAKTALQKLTMMYNWQRGIHFPHKEKCWLKDCIITKKEIIGCLQHYIIYSGAIVAKAIAGIVFMDLKKYKFKIEE